jgi:hypothetical protein
VNHEIEAVILVIVKAPVDVGRRAKWLEFGMKIFGTTRVLSQLLK